MRNKVLIKNSSLDQELNTYIISDLMEVKQNLNIGITYLYVKHHVSLMDKQNRMINSAIKPISLNHFGRLLVMRNFSSTTHKYWMRKAR